MQQPVKQHSELSRRGVVTGLAGTVASMALPGAIWAQTAASSAPGGKAPLVGPLAPNPAAFKKAVDDFTGKATPQSEGLQLEVPSLADNPAAVPVKVKVTLPITDTDWCEEIIVLADLNPSPVACRLQFTAATGTAEAALRVRLAQSQNIHALARMKSGKVLTAKQAVTVAASGCGM